jgi:NADH-quinone oxidoreductase subunit A
MNARVDPLSSYLPLVAALGAAGLLGAAILVITPRLGARSRGLPIKGAPFECGSNPVGSARQRIAVRFFVVALLFLVFDLETVFFYPWAVDVRGLGWLGFLEILSFAATLALGLIYVWKRGALDWE